MPDLVFEENMNKITKKLCNEAGIDVNYLTNTKQIGLIEKLVELVVNECMNICEELGDKGLDGHYCVDKIKEHFGEE